MINGTNGAHPDKMEEVAGGAGEPQEQDTITAMVRRMVAQSGALLRQQLEHKVKQEPMLYDQARVDQIIGQFGAASEDVQAIIADRVRSRLISHIHQEVLRLLEDALSDSEESLEDPIWNHRVEQAPPTITRQPPRQSEGQRPTVEEEDTRGGPQTGGEEFPGGEGTTGVPPAQHPPEPAALATAEEQDEVTEVSQTALSSESTEQGLDLTSDSQGLPGDPPQGLLGELYEGTVMLRVDATDSVRQVIQFVDALRRKSDFRLLQLVGNHDQGVGVWLGLRAPVLLKEILLQMEGVAEVDASGWLEQHGHEPQLKVRLAGALLPK